MRMRRAPRWMRVAMVGTLGAAVIGGVVAYEVKHAWPRRFAEVDAGKFYRGGYPTQRHLEVLHAQKNIRSVLSMVSPRPDDPRRCDEEKVATDLGLTFLRLPMPGNGTGEFESLDAAADFLAEPGNQPVFFHCAAGKQRSNAVLAAYRMKHCGWTVEQALAELDEFGLDRVKEAKLCEHLVGYYHARIRHQ